MPKEVRSWKALGGGFCPYLSGQEIADRPLKAVWCRFGSDRQKRYGARRAWEGDFVRTCRAWPAPPPELTISGGYSRTLRRASTGSLRARLLLVMCGPFVTCRARRKE